MRVALFVPCYVDQLAPSVAVATLRLLESLGVQVSYCPEQTCCGQPLLHAGGAAEATRLAEAHLRRFRGAEAIVCPSASCVSTVRRRYGALGVGTCGFGEEVRSRTFELGEFLVKQLGRTEVGAHFPHRVALLQSCHGLRELELGAPSEAVRQAAPPGSTEALLRAVRGLDLVFPERRDECCGFGGGFAVEFPELSTRMGRESLRALEATGAEYVTAVDAGCLLHLDGIRRRERRGPVPIHLAEILAAELRK